MCMMKKVFLPLFFDVMSYLLSIAVVNLRPCAQSVDVLNRTVPENIQGLCSSEQPFEGIRGSRLRTQIDSEQVMYTKDKPFAL